MTEAQATETLQYLADMSDKLSLISVATYIIIGVIIGVTISKVLGAFIRDI